jgi:uncharacterized protein YkwD
MLRFSICVFLLVIQTAANADTADVKEVARRVVEQTNAFRVENKRPEVKTNDVLTQVADQFAQFMARTGKYGHEADGRTPSQRVSAAGYDWAIVLENIQMQYDSSDFMTEDLANRAVEGWKNSPPHRKNMLDSDVTETGVAFARSEDGHYYGVQVFARPQSAAIKFTIVNKSPNEIQYKLLDKTYKLAPLTTRIHTLSRPEKVQFFPGQKTEQTIEPKSDATYMIRSDAAGKPKISEASSGN